MACYPGSCHDTAAYIRLDNVHAIERVADSRVGGDLDTRGGGEEGGDGGAHGEGPQPLEAEVPSQYVVADDGRVVDGRDGREVVGEGRVRRDEEGQGGCEEGDGKERE